MYTYVPEVKNFHPQQLVSRNEVELAVQVEFLCRSSAGGRLDRNIEDVDEAKVYPGGGKAHLVEPHTLLVLVRFISLVGVQISVATTEPAS